MKRSEESYLKYLKLVERRFWGYVNKNGKMAHGMVSRCWEWTGTIVKGYGQFNIPVERKQVTKYAHRCSWALANGPLPPHGFSLHHLCGNKLCVNANHMAMLTQHGHSRIHTIALNASCLHGHPFDEDNPLIDSKGYRRCRECAAEHRKSYNKRRGRKNAT